MCICWYRNYSEEMPLQVSSNASPNNADASIQGKLGSWFGGQKKAYYDSYQIVRFYTFCIIFGIASLCVSYWMLSHLSPWEWQGTDKPIKSQSQLWGVTGYTFLFPFGFMLTMTGLSGIVIIKEISPRLRAFIMGFFAFAALFSLVSAAIFSAPFALISQFRKKYTNIESF